MPLHAAFLYSRRLRVCAGVMKSSPTKDNKEAQSQIMCKLIVISIINKDKLSKKKKTKWPKIKRNTNMHTCTHA